MVAGKYNNSFKSKFVEDFIDDVGSSNSSYYIGFGRGYEWADDNNPPATNGSIQTSYLEVYRDLLFGKKIGTSDVQYCTRKIEWVSDTVYDQYDHLDPDIFSKNYYVINTSNRVYKCLFNNYGAPSTVMPTSTLTTGDFKTSDGYVWKYMYRVNSLQEKRFSSSTNIPVIPDYYVPQYATEGAIHTILVTNPGSKYETATGYCDAALSTSLFKLSNSNLSSITGAYSLSTFYISAGTGQNDRAIISDYTVNTSGKFITTSTPLYSVDSTTYFTICPTVQVSGDGAGCFAISNVNATSGAIESIDVIDIGSSYHYADINIIANTAFGSNGTARAVIAPPGGHGSDVINELGVDKICISLDINTSDNFPDWATYRQVSLLNNPTAIANNNLYRDSTFFQYLQLSIGNAYFLMYPGEQVYGFTSGAVGYVLNMDATSIVLRDVTGTFLPFESIVSSDTGVTCTITAINNKDLIPYTGNVYYYRNLEPISRTGATSEQVKLYFKI